MARYLGGKTSLNLYEVSDIGRLVANEFNSRGTKVTASDMYSGKISNGKELYSAMAQVGKSMVMANNRHYSIGELYVDSPLKDLVDMAKDMDAIYKTESSPRLIDFLSGIIIAKTKSRFGIRFG